MIKKRDPKISVIMPVYNQEKYVAAAIKSILKQTIKDFEFLIMDDGSKDESLTIIKSFVDKRIKIFRHKHRKGLAKSLNFLLRKAKGKYIARMDGDDISLTARLKTQADFLDNNSNMAMVGSWAKIINGQHKTIGEFKYPTQSESIRQVIISYNPFVHPSVMFKKKIIDKIGNFDEKLIYSQDYDFFLRLVAKYACANINDFLIQFRWLPNYNKQKEQHKIALQVRFKAIKLYGYHWWELIKLINPSLLYLVPICIKRFYWNKKFNE